MLIPASLEGDFSIFQEIIGSWYESIGDPSESQKSVLSELAREYEKTQYGKHIFVIGGNVNTAYNFGLNVHRHLFGVFIMSGVISGITGWLMVARSSGATPAMASGFLFEVLAAVIIGGVSMSGGVGSLVGVFAGVLLLSSIRSALNILAISPFKFCY